MGYISYTEDITERLIESRRRMNERMAELRRKISDSDFLEQRELHKEAKSFKATLVEFLDELEARSSRVYEDAIKKIKDPSVGLHAYRKKRDKQLEEVRKERDQTRKANVTLVAERDNLRKELQILRKQLVTLQKENAKQVQNHRDELDWVEATQDVKRR